MARLRRHLDSKKVQIEKLRLDLERALSQGGAEGDEGEGGKGGEVVNALNSDFGFSI